MVNVVRTITAIAPAKAILIGEHAVNRGQAALAVSVGLHVTCRVVASEQVSGDGGIRLVSDAHTQTTTRTAILDLGRVVDRERLHENYAAIHLLARDDFFAPAKYVLAALGDALPAALDICWTNSIPQSAGLGSGGAACVALAAAIGRLIERDHDRRELAAWAQRGDILAHGGIASGLDTQTSLYGGAIRYTTAAQGAPLPYADGLALVIGNTGVVAATSAVNGRVRAWLEHQPVRLHYFHEIGMLSRLAEQALLSGDWRELGQLLNLNQLILERIGVSCEELQTLIDAALEAGALGAKLSGSGGGGIMIALVEQERIGAVAQAIEQAGGTAIVAPVGVPGVTVQTM